MDAYIKAISYYLPDKILDNGELADRFPEWGVDKIASKVGISSRHIASTSQTATDMAYEAAERLFIDHQIKRKEVDYILFCTQSPDYLLPTSACLLQARLGLPTSVGALDFNLGCSGFVYGLSLAKGLVNGGIARNVLLLTGETYSKYIHPNDKGNLTIFGDAATATLISTDGFAKIMNFSLGTDGGGYGNLIVKNGGARFPRRGEVISYDENENFVSPDYLYMNGKEIFEFTVQQVPVMINKLLSKHCLTLDKVNLFVFHQANKYMLNFIRKVIGVDREKFYLNFENYGNTVSSTIPIALYNAEKEDKLHGNIVLAGFGVGYSWGSTILEC